MLKEPKPVIKHLHLKVVPPFVGCSTQQKDPLAVAVQKGREAIETHVRAQCHGIGPVAVEGFCRILFGGCANVASFGIKQPKMIGVMLLNPVAKVFKHRLSSEAGEVGNLWLEGACVGCCGFNNALAKLLNAGECVIVF